MAWVGMGSGMALGKFVAASGVRVGGVVGCGGGCGWCGMGDIGCGRMVSCCMCVGCVCGGVWSGWIVV